MKTTLCALILGLLTVTGSVAEEFRTWTQDGTKRTIVAKISDKKLDDSAARVRTKTGQYVWLQTRDLIAADQDYIKKWVKPVDRLTVRVTGSGKGLKKIEVVAQAGPKTMRVKGKRPSPKPPVDYEVAAGQSFKFEFWAPREYWVRAYENGKLMEEETDKTKTGL